MRDLQLAIGHPLFAICQFGQHQLGCLLDAGGDLGREAFTEIQYVSDFNPDDDDLFWQLCPQLPSQRQRSLQRRIMHRVGVEGGQVIQRQPIDRARRAVTR